MHHAIWPQDQSLPCVAAMRAVVAVPVRNEAQRISRCLDGLLAQRDLAGRRPPPCDVGLVLLFNNCTDDSAARARARLEGTALPFILAEVTLPPERAHAGTARRMAMDIAATWMERSGRTDGVLLTTDADTTVPADWIARNLDAARTCAAVAGRFRLAGDGTDALPEPLRRRIRLEQAYEDRLLRLAARLDPRAHDPWPNHRMASGASYAIRLAAYRAIGGLPPVPSGEDRALTRALEARDLPIRHDPGIVVLTSPRLAGRAQGGCAEALRARAACPDLPGDPALEPVLLAARRFAWRGRLRRLHAAGRPGAAGGASCGASSGASWGASWGAALRLPAAARDWMEEAYFGQAWARIEATSPRLAPRALRPAELAAQIRIADGILAAGAPLSA